MYKSRVTCGPCMDGGSCNMQRSRMLASGLATSLRTYIAACGGVFVFSSPGPHRPFVIA